MTPRRSPGDDLSPVERSRALRRIRKLGIRLGLDIAGPSSRLFALVRACDLLSGRVAVIAASLEGIAWRLQMEQRGSGADPAVAVAVVEGSASWLKIT